LKYAFLENINTNQIQYTTLDCQFDEVDMFINIKMEKTSVTNLDNFVIISNSMPELEISSPRPIYGPVHLTDRYYLVQMKIGERPIFVNDVQFYTGENNFNFNNRIVYIKVEIPLTVTKQKLIRFKRDDLSRFGYLLDFIEIDFDEIDLPVFFSMLVSLSQNTILILMFQN